MTRELEKITAFEKAKSHLFFSGIQVFLKFGAEIQAEYLKRKESFDFIECFLDREDFNNHSWQDVDHHLKSLKDFHEKILHHQHWQGAREIDPRLWEVIGIAKRIYVILRQEQQGIMPKQKAVQTSG